MSLLFRITDFVPSTLIKSQEMDDELNQLVNLLSGVSTNKDTLLKFSDGSNPVLRVDQLGAGLIQQWLNNGTSRASLSALGKLLLPAGIGATPSADQISNLGTYFSDFTDRTTPASTVETDFSSKTLSSNVLASDGDFLIIYAGGNFAGNANSKRYRLYFNGANAFDSGTAAFNGTSFTVLSFLLRKSSSALVSTVLRSIGTTAQAESYPIAGQNFGVSNVLKSTGQNSTASANDIVQNSFIMLKGSV